MFEMGDCVNLRCPYNGPQSFDLIWSNDTLGQIVNTLSHCCLNGSLSHLNIEDWNEICFPTSLENVPLRRMTGVWSLFNFLVGIMGNLLTLLSIPYAKSKRRYDFHRTFWVNDVWVLHLALCDLIFSTFCAPHYFIPYLGYRYPQGYGSDIFCEFSFALTVITYTNHWLCLATIALTRAIKMKHSSKWTDFCHKKGNIFAVCIGCWILQVFILLPIFIDPQIENGYHCLMGKCNYSPTGEAPLPLFEMHPWIVQKFPYMANFLIPFIVIVGSYLTIWLHLRKTRRSADRLTNLSVPSNKRDKLDEKEVRFIWTIFIIFICYLTCAAPVSLFADVLGIKSDIPFLIVIGFMYLQYSLNIFIYAYRSTQYRAAYRDFLVTIIPSLEKLGNNWKPGVKFSKTATGASDASKTLYALNWKTFSGLALTDLFENKNRSNSNFDS